MSVVTKPWPPGTPCWADLGVPDTEAAQSFYSALLGWQWGPASAEFGGYTNAIKEHHVLAGLGPQMDPDDPPRWTTYFATDDSAKTLARVREAGGTVTVEPMQVGPLGTMSMAVDPQGTPFGLWESGQHTGFTAIMEQGTYLWCEGEYSDPDAARAFYAAVFDYTYDPVPEAGDYATFKTAGADVVGGIGGTGLVTEGVRPGWLLYFGVADVDAALETVQQQGGRRLTEPEDTPYGRMAVVADPWGARFAVMTVADEAA